MSKRTSAIVPRGQAASVSVDCLLLARRPLVILLALVGCSSGSGVPPSDAPDSGGQVASSLGGGGGLPGTAAGGTGGPGGSGATAGLAGGAGGGCSADAAEAVDVPWEPGPCEGEGFEQPPNRALGTLTMQLVDPGDQPVAGVWAQACTTTQCLPMVGRTDARGVVSVGSADGGLITGQWPTIEYGDGITFTRWAMNPPRQSGDVGPQRVFRLPPLTTATPFPVLDSAKRAVAGGWAHAPSLHLFIEAGTEVVISRIAYGSEEERGLRAVEIPLDLAPDGVDREVGFELVLSATPSGAEFCPPVRLVTCNTPGWPPGASVEVFAQAVTPPIYEAGSGTWSQGWAPGSGGWGKVAEGVVTADGRLIAATRGGLPFLTNIAIRRKTDS